LEVHVNTIYQDLDCLRDDENAPIDYDASAHGFFLRDPTWELSPIQISHGELFAFSVATKMIEAFRSTPLAVDMQSVVKKIQSSLMGKARH
jgi:predicted DNA-binding transcriptional regulator YafY